MFSNRERSRSIKSRLPTYVGTVWSMPVAGTSRRRSVPVVPAPPAASAMNAIGFDSKWRRYFPSRLSTCAPRHELVHAVPRGAHQRRRRAVNKIAGGEQIPTRCRELLPIEDPEDRPEDVVAPHVRRAVQWIEDDRETSAAEVLHLSHFLRGDLGDEVRFAARVHEEVIHPDIEFELLLPVCVPGRRGIPPDRQLPPDSVHEAGEPGQQEAEIAVDLPGVLRERDIRPAASFST